MAVSDLDRALDELYGASPEEFVLVRSRLERELRDRGDRAAAAEVRGRRRPNLAAWAVNQLARAEPDDVAALAAATRRLADAQAGVLRGDAADRWRQDARDRQELLGRLAGDAVRLLRGRAPKPDGYRDAITGTLDAATVDPTVAAELLAGRLTRPLSPPAGFGPAADIATPAAPAGRTDRGADSAARHALADARRAAKAAASEQTSAELRADAADAHLREVERALERARANAGQGAEQVRVARARAGEAQAALEAAAVRVQRAEAEVGRRGR